MAVLADAVPYTGQTAEHRRVVVDVRGRSVVGVRVGLLRYRCETFGDVGPLVVRESGHARIGADGRFTFRAGEEAQTVTVRGTLRRATRRIAGHVRVSGSIATGQKCASGTLRFTATR